MPGKVEVGPSRRLAIWQAGLSSLGDGALSTAYGEDFSYRFSTPPRFKTQEDVGRWLFNRSI
jgi:hypothetical protein